jgi:hypothetical protein
LALGGTGIVIGLATVVLAALFFFALEGICG